jgi:hypothetical protein
LDCQESRERKCNVDDAQEKDAVNTDFDFPAHVQIMDDEKWEAENYEGISPVSGQE